MNESLSKRVSAASRAAWWTLLIGVVWMTAYWFLCIGAISRKPAWLMKFWGGMDDWKQVHDVIVCYFAIMELILFTMFMATIWLTLWARKLRRAEQ